MNPLTARSPDNSNEKEVKDLLKFVSEHDGGKKTSQIEECQCPQIGEGDISQII
jgi:hypothetical protein